MELLTQVFELFINGIYALTKDYGIAIVIITIAIRSCLIPLNIKQRKQMRKQQQTALQAEALKMKYAKTRKSWKKNYKSSTSKTALVWEAVSYPSYSFRLCMDYIKRFS